MAGTNPVTVGYQDSNGGVAVTATTPLPVTASSSAPTATVGVGDVIAVTLTPDTSQMADNDVIAATQEITGFFRSAGGRARLQTVVLLDEDDQGQDIDLVFLHTTGSVGAENAVFAPSDAVAATIVGVVSIVAADYIDANTSMIASGIMPGNGLLMEAASASTSVFIAAVCRSGTPTYTAAGLKLLLGVAWE